MTYKNESQIRLIWFLAILAISNIYLSPALAQSGRYNNWHMGRWMMGDWGMGWFGMIFMFVFWGLIIVGIVFLVKWVMQTAGNRSGSHATTNSKSMDILKERYARGEITHDEFVSMKNDILQ